LGVPVACATYDSALKAVKQLAGLARPSAICPANTHILGESRHNPVFGQVLAKFDLVLPDGMPVVWALNRQGAGLKDRVYGPYFMRHVLRHTPRPWRHFFFGDSEACLADMRRVAAELQPDIEIVGTLSPPFGAFTEEDEQTFAQAINQTAPDFVWVALPGVRMEEWIIANMARFQRGVFLAVGDAFTLLTGRRKFAPRWMQRLGMTWLYRALHEPGRLGPRYLQYNFIYLYYTLLDSFARRPILPTAPAIRRRLIQKQDLESINILGVGIHVINMDRALEMIAGTLERKEKGYICVTGVHGVSEAQKDEGFRQILNRAFLCTPDGMPLVWLGWWRGKKEMDRVYGPDLMLAMLELSEMKGYRHFFYGGANGTAEALREKLRQRYPELQIVGTYEPPFRPLNAQEEGDLKKLVQDARPDIMWIGLSTPKQEKFMAEYLGQLEVTLMAGVGAAFDYISGRRRQAPRWMQRSGLEWLFRLMQEPRRLWKRYLINNPLFLIRMVGQGTGLRKYPLRNGKH
jgi:N-acetylglucosaminyldiphosphoundecaprenol N-acetyl-beta-D-mannosaminyltransferase